MVGSRSGFPDGLAMSRSRIAFVSGPSIFGIILINGGHILISVGFGKHGCGSNVHVYPVTLDDGLKRNVMKGMKAITIHKDQLWWVFQLPESPVHGEYGCIEDIDLIYLRWISPGYPKGKATGFYDGP